VADQSFVDDTELGLAAAEFLTTKLEIRKPPKNKLTCVKRASKKNREDPNLTFWYLSDLGERGSPFDLDKHISMEDHAVNVRE